MSFQIKAKVLNLNSVLGQLKAAPADILHAAGAELKLEADGIMAQSKEIVPVDFGNLKNSGHVENPVISGTTATVDLGYGNAAVKYATPVHENLEANHPGGGTAKYLEIPYKAALPGMPGRVAAGIRSRLK